MARLAPFVPLRAAPPPRTEAASDQMRSDQRRAAALSCADIAPGSSAGGADASVPGSLARAAVPAGGCCRLGFEALGRLCRIADQV